MVKVWPSKDPDEELRYTYDWAPDLAEAESIDAVLLFDPITATGIVIESTQPTAKTFTVVLSGGLDGETGSWTLRVHTDDDNTFEDIVMLPIVAKVLPVPHPGDYTPPTAAHLVSLFPEFSGVHPDKIEYWLTRAARDVDNSWTKGDFAHARMLLAAHLMTSGGIGASQQAASINDGSAEFRSMGIGSLRLERFAPGGSSKSRFATTRYGSEYAGLLRKNRGGPRVTGGLPRSGGGDGNNFGPWTQ